ncbi:MAG: aminoglycoside phosphotransferase family protein [Colwelliaceae bacterium]|nr:aminoglycoside phosphotransferase family protein [Colwelliaceae bacterium]
MSNVVDKKSLNEVLAFYHCSLNNSTVSPLGNGLINQTYLVRSINNNFVLQRINDHVFKQPEQVINNAELINNHLKNKQDQNQYPLEPMWQITSNNDSPMVKTTEGFWRAIKFIPNCYTVEAVETSEQAEQVATAFGQFTSALSDFPTSQLKEIIPDFHNLDFRLGQLKKAVVDDPKNRLSQCQQLVDFCFEQNDFIKRVADLVASLPVQVTHNDTKINNLLFNSETHKPIAVIDLDTCMPGFIMHDFGDMVRTCCSNLAEDATDLENMHIRMDIFESLAKAYTKSFNGKISELEQESLIIGAQLLPFMIGIRFLTDYIDGDNYFHTNHDLHNLERAQNQLHLFKLLNSTQHQLAKSVFFK